MKSILRFGAVVMMALAFILLPVSLGNSQTEGESRDRALSEPQTTTLADDGTPQDLSSPSKSSDAAKPSSRKALKSRKSIGERFSSLPKKGKSLPLFDDQFEGAGGIWWGILGIVGGFLLGLLGYLGMINTPSSVDFNGCILFLSCLLIFIVAVAAVPAGIVLLIYGIATLGGARTRKAMQKKKAAQHAKGKAQHR